MVAKGSSASILHSLNPSMSESDKLTELTDGFLRFVLGVREWATMASVEQRSMHVCAGELVPGAAGRLKSEVGKRNECGSV